jgi:pimeloyl-ACP methyl ester carboxylesterase
MNSREEFINAQQRMLDRYHVEAQSQFINVPSVDGRAHVLVFGEGPPVMMVTGIQTPGAMWAPLMAELNGFSLYAVDLPGFGLTDTTDTFSENLKDNAIRFLIEVMDGLELESPFLVANSMGALWTSWLCLDQPKRVSALVHIGCPALVLNTSAPFPMRLLAVKGLGRFLIGLQPPSSEQVEQLSKMIKEHPFFPELTDLLLKTEQLPEFRQTFLSMLSALLRLRGGRPSMKLTAKQLVQIDKPIRLFWGKDDPFGSPEVGKRMAEIMPEAELNVIEGGHTPWLKQSKQISSIITRFLHHYRE